MKAICILLFALFLIAYPSNNAIAGDGVWDYNKGGIDRDLDNDGTWDYSRGGIDKDLDNDGVWDYDNGGIDRDVDVPF